MGTFVESIENLSITQKRVAEGYMKDGTIDELCPPLHALVKVMVEGSYKGMDRHDPEFRKLFDKKSVIDSDWYKKRLAIKQEKDINLWSKNIDYLKKFMEKKNFQEASNRLNIPSRLEYAKTILTKVKSPAYLKELEGTIGADPLGS